MSEEPLLRVEHLTKVFTPGPAVVRAVDDVALVAHPGELALVMGPSGSGKTTLLSMIGGILRPTEGRVLIGGIEITSLPRRALPRVRRELVGFVFQSFNLLESLSALENVEIVLNLAGIGGPEAAARARELLVEAGLEHRLDFRAPDLSAGERQRVAIARALANQPRLLLADEPTANLDSAHGREVMALLRELTRQRRAAALVVSHDERLLEIADRVYRLEDGRLDGRADRPDAAPRFRASPDVTAAGRAEDGGDRKGGAMGDSPDRGETGRPAGSTQTLVDALRKSGSDFEFLPHPQTFSAAAEAHALGVLEEDVAKTLVLRDDRGGHIRAVVPASSRLDLDKLAREVGAREVTLLGEPELLDSYPQFELGAVPPLSGPPGDVVVVDRRLAEGHHVVLEAGVHDTSVRLRTKDLLAAAGARVADIAAA